MDNLSNQRIFCLEFTNQVCLRCSYLMKYSTQMSPGPNWLTLCLTEANTCISVPCASYLQPHNKCLIYNLHIRFPHLHNPSKSLECPFQMAYNTEKSKWVYIQPMIVFRLTNKPTSVFDFTSCRDTQKLWWSFVRISIYIMCISITI